MIIRKIISFLFISIILSLPLHAEKLSTKKFQEKPYKDYYLASTGNRNVDLNSDSLWWVNKNSIVKIGKKRRAWVIANFKENESLISMNGSIKFKSEKMYIEFDCIDQYKPLHSSYYSDWGAKMQDQLFVDKPLDKYYLINPESSLFVISKQICS